MVVEASCTEGAEMGIPQTTGREAARWGESRHDAVKTERRERLDAGRCADTIEPPQECPGNGYDELLFRGNLWSRNSFAWIGCGMQPARSIEGTGVLFTKGPVRATGSPPESPHSSALLPGLRNRGPMLLNYRRREGSARPRRRSYSALRYPAPGEQTRGCW